MTHVDNECVFKVMIGQWGTTDALFRYKTTAVDLCDKLRALGLAPIEITRVSENHPTHKLVHQMTKNAHNQVLVRQLWRPSDEPPASNPLSATPEVPPQPVADDDIPF